MGGGCKTAANRLIRSALDWLSRGTKVRSGAFFTRFWMVSATGRLGGRDGGGGLSTSRGRVRAGLAVEFEGEGFRNNGGCCMPRAVSPTTHINQVSWPSKSPLGSQESRRKTKTKANHPPSSF